MHSITGLHQGALRSLHTERPAYALALLTDMVNKFLEVVDDGGIT